METLDGKETLHATVGHTYQNVLQDDEQAKSNPIAFREKRNRRSFVGNEREIPAFKKSLHSAEFISPTAAATSDTVGSALSTHIHTRMCCKMMNRLIQIQSRFEKREIDEVLWETKRNTSFQEITPFCRIYQSYCSSYL